MDDAFPVLYILMRSDLQSMNAGKGMAQASHASNAFVKRMRDGFAVERDANTPAQDMFNVWQLSTDQGFGTVIVLEVTEIQMRTAFEVVQALGFISGIVHDPTYPLRDGDFCHFIPLDTCAYVFGDKNNTMLGAVLNNFNLHP